MYLQKAPNTASRKSTGITLALPQGKCNAPDPSTGSGTAGGTAAPPWRGQRARFQAVFLAQASSVKMVLSRPTWWLSPSKPASK